MEEVVFSGQEAIIREDIARRSEIESPFLITKENVKSIGKAAMQDFNEAEKLKADSDTVGHADFIQIAGLYERSAFRLDLYHALRQERNILDFAEDLATINSDEFLRLTQ